MTLTCHRLCSDPEIYYKNRLVYTQKLGYRADGDKIIYNNQIRYLLWIYISEIFVCHLRMKIQVTNVLSRWTSSTLLLVCAVWWTQHSLFYLYFLKYSHKMSLFINMTRNGSLLWGVSALNMLVFHSYWIPLYHCMS